MAKNKYSKRDLDRFRKKIQQKIDELTGNMDGQREDLNINSKGNASLSQDSVYSVHMADAGTDSYEREKGFHLMNRETNYVNFLNLALERIDSGEFGICSVCDDKIPEERMMEVPNATKCVTCKEGEKLNPSQS
jgi:RNA polymerase-binding transcription factor DksA